MNYEIDITDIKEYNTHKKNLNIDSSALLIIEMQNVFKGDLISEKQINNVQNLIRFADNNDIKKIFVRHSDDSDSSSNMIEWWGGDKIVKGTREWEIIDDINTQNEIIIDKNQYSAFYNTNLDTILKENNITDIIICGVMTNCCCETATRDAFMRGYNVFFISDATGTINADLHLSAIKNIAFGFATVQNTADIIK